MKLKKSDIIFGSIIIVAVIALVVQHGFRIPEQANQSITTDDNPKQSVAVDDSVRATFDYPNGWAVDTGSNSIALMSQDLQYKCEDGKLYTDAEMTRLWSGTDGMGPCFRAPIETGSRIWIINGGDMGLANFTLDNIPDHWTDGNQRDSIKNIRRIKVDGYDAVMWEDSYGDSPVSNLTVAIIKDHGIYQIKQEWKDKAENPYPAVVQSIVDSFKFSS